MATDQQLRYLISVQDAELKELRGELKKTNKELGDGVEKSASKAGGGFEKARKGATVASLAIGGVAVVAVKGFIAAASDAQRVQNRTESQMKALGISYKRHAKQIDEVVNRTSKLAALDDEDLQTSFTRLLPSTNNVSKALKEMGIAADIARSQNISLESATKLLLRANTGSAGALRKLGLTVHTITEAQDNARLSLAKYKEEHKKITPEVAQHFKDLQAAAKATDRQSQAQYNLAQLQKLFGGAAADYGKTAAAAGDRARVAWENVQESLGKQLLPVLALLGNKLADLLGWVEKHQTAAKILIGVVVGLAGAVLAVEAGLRLYAAATKVATAVQWLWNAAMDANPIALFIIGLVAVGAAFIVLWHKSETFRDIVRGAMSGVQEAIGWVRTGIEWIRDHAAEAWAVAKWAPPVLAVKLMVAELKLVRAAGEWIIDHVADIWAVAKWVPPIALIRGAVKVIAGHVDDLADGLKKVKDLIEWIVDHAKDIAGKFGFVGSAFGKVADLAGKIPGLGGDRNSSAGTHPILNVTDPQAVGSINPGLWDELSLGRSMGLYLASGYRTPAQNAAVGGVPGSKHTTYPSKAIDMSGTYAQMRAFALGVMGRPGIDEVFFDPLGFYEDRGVYRRGAIGGHSDHVHVGVFDRGGWLEPGLTLAMNATGMREQVIGPGGGGDTVYLSTGDVYGDGGIDALAEKLVTALAKRGRRNVNIFAGRA